MLSDRKHIDKLKKRIKLLEEVCDNLRKNHIESETEKKYLSLFEMSDDAILVIEDNTFVDCNNAVVKMLKYNSKEELLNTHPSELSPIKQPDGRFSFEKAQEMMQIALDKGSHHFEWIHTKATGEDFPVEVWLSRVKYDDKILINTIWRDLTEKKLAEATILHNIKEKEVLLKEIHHRVKNNLQIVSSLINLQAAVVDDERVTSVLFQCKSRIESMAKVHQMLYNSDDFSSINYKDYLDGLLKNLVLGIKHDSNSIKLEIVVADNIEININNAVPMGLIINELATNSLKYAFPDKSEGVIHISLTKRSRNSIQLIYKDDGVGFSQNVDDSNTNGLGLQIIKALVDQLSGNLTRKEVAEGVCYKIKLNLS